jgi:hypothetical protein
MISRLMIFRITFCYIMLFPIFFLNDEIFLMIICGGFIVPIVGFIIPILADIKYNSVMYSNGEMFFKIMTLLIAIFINSVFIFNLFKHN